MQCLTTQDGCERPGGNLFCFRIGKRGQGLEKQALDTLDSSCMGAEGGAPFGSLLGHVWGSSLFFKQASSDNAQASLRTVSQGIGKVPRYLFELPVLYIVWKAKVNKQPLFVFCIVCVVKNLENSFGFGFFSK